MQRGWFLGEGLSRRQVFTFNSTGLGYGSLFYRKKRFAGLSIQYKGHAHLGGLHDRGSSFPVDGHI